MKRVRLTLKNYRCFSDENPGRFEIGGGFTAIVGPNNSGKSVTKLMFYELRGLFAFLGSNIGAVSQIFTTGYRFDLSYLSVSDPTEIFHNQNDRPLSIEIEVLDAEAYPNQGADDCINRIVAGCGRENPEGWSFKAYRAKDPNKNLVRTNQLGSAGPYVVSVDRTDFDMKDIMEACAVLGKTNYYGPFRNALNKGAGKHFDLTVGTSFADLWNDWKTAGNRAHAREIDQLSESIRSLFGFRKLEISSSKNLESLMIAIDGHLYRLDELGSGIAQFIIVLGNAAINRPEIILIDEPETNLHPALQKNFLSALASYAPSGIMFSTHSIGLARSIANSIYSIQRQDSRSTIRPFEATDNYLEFVGELSFSAFRDLGHEKVLLVEGVEDVLAVQQILRIFGKDHRVVVIPLGGSQLICAGRDKEIGELFRVSKDVSALIDSERTAGNEALSANHQAFLETCEKAKVKVCVSERRAIENYFTDRAVKLALGNKFASLGPFDLLRERPNAWPKRDNWRIAAKMTEEELLQTDVGKFLKEF